MRIPQQGIASLIIIVGVLLLLGVAGTAYYLAKTGTMSPIPLQIIEQIHNIQAKEMIVKGYVKDVRTKKIIPNPQVTSICELALNKTCESFNDGSFVCKPKVKEGEHCGIYVKFTTSGSGKIEDTALAQYIAGQPDQTLDIGDMFVPLENREDQKNAVEAFNLFESYLKAYIKEDWNQINNLGIDCGLDKTLAAKYGLRWFIGGLTGRNGDIYSYGVDLRDCEKGCDIQKNKILSYELYLQKVSQQWKCWNKSK